eukprot:scaffold368_cov258-Pinguiococcus_pyrenoidosus.AAC.50
MAGRVADHRCCPPDAPSSPPRLRRATDTSVARARPPPYRGQKRAAAPARASERAVGARSSEKRQVLAGPRGSPPSARAPPAASQRGTGVAYPELEETQVARPTLSRESRGSGRGPPAEQRRS